MFSGVSKENQAQCIFFVRLAIVLTVFLGINPIRYYFSHSIIFKLANRMLLVLSSNVFLRSVNIPNIYFLMSVLSVYSINYM